MADSDYYTFSPYPSTMQRLVVDGDEVGQHYTMINADGTTVYCARVDVPVDLPPASIVSTRRRPADVTLERFGPVQPIGDELDKLYVARSDAYPFPRDLMTLGLDVVTHKLLAGRPVYVQSLPGAYGDGSEPGGLLAIDVVLDNEREDLKAGIELAKMLARSALRIAAEDRRYRDAYEVLTGTAAGGEPSPEQLEGVMQHIAGATSWVTGTPARVGDAIETRLRLDEVSQDLRGTLHVYWQDAALTTVDVHLDGGLPSIPGANAKLEAAQEGFWAFLKSLGELKTGDQDLDDAFFIKAESDDQHPARNLLLHSRDHLVELGRYGAHVDFTPELLKVRVTAVPYEAAGVAALVSTLLELWRRTVLYRAGFAGASDPDRAMSGPVEVKIEVGSASGTWCVVDGLFLFRGYVGLETPLGLATSYWTYKVQDLGPRLVTRVRWLKAHSEDREAAQYLLSRPPPTSVEAALFHRKVAARLEHRVTLELETEGDAEARAAAVPLCHWLLDRALALKEREHRGGLELNEIAPLTHGGETRGYERLSAQPRPYRYRVTLETRVPLTLSIFKTTGGPLEVSGAVDDADAARSLRALEVPARLTGATIDGRLDKQGGFLEIDGANLHVPAARQFTRALLNELTRLTIGRSRDRARRLRGEVDADALETLRVELTDATALYSGWAARTAEDQLEVKLELAALQQSGTLRVRALDLDAHAVELSLRADLPAGPSSKIRATQGGLVDWVLNRFDARSEHADLDARFLIEADEPGLEELEALAAHWLRAAPVEATLEPEGATLNASCARDDAKAVAASLIGLWRALAAHRAGAADG